MTSEENKKTYRRKQEVVVLEGSAKPSEAESNERRGAKVMNHDEQREIELEVAREQALTRARLECEADAREDMAHRVTSVEDSKHPAVVAQRARDAQPPEPGQRSGGPAAYNALANLRGILGMPKMAPETAEKILEG